MDELRIDPELCGAYSELVQPPSELTGLSHDGSTSLHTICLAYGRRKSGEGTLFAYSWKLINLDNARYLYIADGAR